MNPFQRMKALGYTAHLSRMRGEPEERVILRHPTVTAKQDFERKAGVISFRTTGGRARVTGIWVNDRHRGKGLADHLYRIAYHINAVRGTPLESDRFFTAQGLERLKKSKERGFAKGSLALARNRPGMTLLRVKKPLRYDWSGYLQKTAKFRGGSEAYDAAQTAVRLHGLADRATERYARLRRRGRKDGLLRRLAAAHARYLARAVRNARVGEAETTSSAFQMLTQPRRYTLGGGAEIPSSVRRDILRRAKKRLPRSWSRWPWLREQHEDLMLILSAAVAEAARRGMSGWLLQNYAQQLAKQLGLDKKRDSRIMQEIYHAGRK